MLKRKDLQDLASLRLREAKILFQAECWDGAYYLAGYAAECALKACIAKQTERHEFPDKKKVLDSYDHNLDKLLNTAGLERVRKQAASLDSAFDSNWRVVASWSEQSRYDRKTQSDAQELLNALQDREHGVLRWLKNHW